MGEHSGSGDQHDWQVVWSVWRSWKCITVGPDMQACSQGAEQSRIGTRHTAVWTWRTQSGAVTHCSVDMEGPEWCCDTLQCGHGGPRVVL